MTTRQILMLTGVAGDDFSWLPGEVIELPEDQAAVWADGVRARYLEPGDFVLTNQHLTDDEAAALKARFLEGAAQPTALAVLEAPEEPGTPPYVFDILDAWATGEPLDFAGHPVPEDVEVRVAELSGTWARARAADPLLERETTVEPGPETPEQPGRETTVPGGPETPEGPPRRRGTGSGRDAWAVYAAKHQVEVTEDMGRDDIIAACELAGVPTGEEA